MFVPSIPRRSIIIFRGVKLEDLTKQPDIAQIATESIRYDRVPNKFNGLSSWPGKCNLRCWHCDLIIDGPPLFVPLTLNMHGDAFQCSTEGVFNRWGCVMAYVDRQYSGRKWEQTRNLVKIVACIFTGNEIKIIPPAPSRTIMQPYGGDLTQEEYLAMISI